MSAPNLFGSNRIKAMSVMDLTLLNNSDFFNDTAAHTRGEAPDNCWHAITATAAAVATLVDFGTTKASVPIPAGCTLWGQFTSITLASGSVMAYRT